MAALTLKTVNQTGGNAGTLALKEAGDLWNKAFENLGGAAKTIQGGIDERFKEDSDTNTQLLLDRINAVDNVGDVEGIEKTLLKTADNQLGRKYDRKTVSEAVRNLRGRVNTDLETNFQNTLAQSNRDSYESDQNFAREIAGANDIATADEIINRAAASNSPNAPEIIANARTAKERILANQDAQRNRTRDVQNFNFEQLKRNQDASQFEVEFDGDMSTMTANMNGIDGLVAKAPPGLRSTYRKELLNQAGYTPEVIMNRVMNTVDDGTGELVGADREKFVKQVKEFDPTIKLTEITKYIDAYKLSTGQKQKEDTAKAQLKRKQDIEDKKEIKLFEDNLKGGESKRRNSFIDTHFTVPGEYDVFGTTAKEDATNVYNYAVKERGYNTPDVERLMIKYAHTSFNNNLDPEEAKKLIDAEFAQEKAAANLYKLITSGKATKDKRAKAQEILDNAVRKLDLEQTAAGYKK